MPGHQHDEQADQRDADTNPPQTSPAERAEAAAERAEAAADRAEEAAESSDAEADAPSSPDPTALNRSDFKASDVDENSMPSDVRRRVLDEKADDGKGEDTDDADSTDGDA